MLPVILLDPGYKLQTMMDPNAHKETMKIYNPINKRQAPIKTAPEETPNFPQVSFPQIYHAPKCKK